MKVIYTYEEPDNKETAEYESLEDFLKSATGYFYKELLSEGRELHTDKITIAVDYPAVITIELKTEEIK